VKEGKSFIAFLLFSLFPLLTFMYWQTSRRRLALHHTLVMAILNVTPDSFSDGGKFVELDAAIRQAEKLAAEGADIIDVGGESTRPGGLPVSLDDELARVTPVIEAIAKRVDIPISIDTTKSVVAREAIHAGAEVVNDISGLRFDPDIARVAAETGAGLVLMHSRGTFETMHSKPPAHDAINDVIEVFASSIQQATGAGVSEPQIAVDIGIGFSKTLDQNLELLANLDKIRNAFPQFPMIVGPSRKSFLGKILGGAQPTDRLSGSIATAIIAAANGANIVRVHDVKEAVEALKTAEAVNRRRIQ